MIDVAGTMGVCTSGQSVRRNITAVGKNQDKTPLLVKKFRDDHRDRNVGATLNELRDLRDKIRSCPYLFLGRNKMEHEICFNR